jgi:hypothetical protein
MFPRVSAIAIVLTLAAVAQFAYFFGPGNTPERAASPIAAAIGIQVTAHKVQYTPTPRPETVKPVPELIQRDGMKELANYDPLDADGLVRMEQIAAPFRTAQQKTSSGSWRLEFYYDGLRQAVMLRYGFPDKEIQFRKLFDEWEAQRPPAATPYIVKAYILKSMIVSKQRTLQSWGPIERQNGKAVHPEIRELEADLARRQNELMQFTIAPNTIAETDPGWYDVKLSTLGNSCAPFAQIWKVLEEGSQKFPDYYQLYRSTLNAGLQCQEIEPGTLMQRLVTLATDRTKNIKGSGTYARLYWGASFYAGNGVLQGSGIDWVRMKSSIDDILSQYSEPWNINHFAKFACLAGEAKTAQDLLPRAQEQVVASVWSRDIEIDDCVSWAMSSATAAPHHVTP